MHTTKTRWQYYLGIDPSAQSSGLALIALQDGIPKRRDCVTITPPSDLRGAARLHYIFEKSRSFLNIQPHGAYPLSRTCIEGASLHSTNRETVLSEVRGIFLLLAYQLGKCEPTKLAPTQLKKFETGSGSASKDEVMRSVLARGNWDPNNDDEADACVAAETAYALDYHETADLTRPQLELVLQLLQGKPLTSSLTNPSRRELNV
jgi:Holliday junction resolvasome RuvABC endonuclease subunit